MSNVDVIANIAVVVVVVDSDVVAVVNVCC